MKCTLALAALVTAFGTAWADPSAPPPSFEKALGEASAKGKPLVLEFWASW